VPLVPIVVVIVLLLNSGGSNSPSNGTAGVLQPVASAPVAATASATQPVRYEVARVITATLARYTPDGSPLALEGTRTSFGSPVMLLVRKNEGAWLGVVAFQAGNNKLAWVQRSAVKISYVSWHIDVNLDKRKLQVFDGRQLEQTFRVAVGKPTAPTPTGTFAVTDRLTTGDPTGPYGCCILALSAVAPHTIQGWDGGDRVAVHSTPDTSTIGDAISHGCIHVTLPEGQWLIDHVPLGSPTVIRSD
jgi:lipoprotein-anchoring transpeptidase ErfK/SrfK